MFESIFKDKASRFEVEQKGFADACVVVEFPGVFSERQLSTSASGIRYSTMIRIFRGILEQEFFKYAMSLSSPFMQAPRRLLS